jgi:N-acetylglutamate synthase-like GNAT family acetyltransferase
MQIRPATRDDIPALNALIERSARELSRGIYEEDEIASAIRYVFGVDSSLVADGTYYVIADGRATLGCGGWSRRRALYGRDAATAGRVHELLDPATDPARIRAFFVAPEAARRGVGRALLDACTSAARAAGFTSLELMATLPGAPFYRSQGFIDAEPVVDTLPDGVRLRFIRMTRALDPD